MNQTLQKLFTKIENSFYFMRHDARKAVNGNKSAGARSRKESSELAALLKQWRAESIAAEKVSKP